MQKDDRCFTLDLDGKHIYKTYSAYINSNNQVGYDKRCDFIIIRYQNDQWQVYFGDLKSKRVEPENILKNYALHSYFSII